MAKSFFKQYLWLVDLLYRHGHLQLSEIKRHWLNSSLNEYKKELADRSFHNHKQAIYDTFGIEICYDKSQGYYISSNDMLSDKLRRYMLESLSLNNILNESTSIKEKILFEQVPSSQKWLDVFVAALKDTRAVVMSYQSFHREHPVSFVAHPYCLKLFKQRWYVLARSENYDKARIYALDRISELELSTTTALDCPKDFDPEAYFRDYFGIIVGTEEEVVDIDIAVRADQLKYFRSLPLHHSQTEIETCEDYGVFRYHLVPTFDFYQELCAHFCEITVLRPASVRNALLSRINESLERYASEESEDQQC